MKPGLTLSRSILARMSRSQPSLGLTPLPKSAVASWSLGGTVSIAQHHRFFGDCVRRGRAGLLARIGFRAAGIEQPCLLRKKADLYRGVLRFALACRAGPLKIKCTPKCFVPHPDFLGSSSQAHSFAGITANVRRDVTISGSIWFSLSPGDDPPSGSIPRRSGATRFLHPALPLERCCSRCNRWRVLPRLPLHGQLSQRPQTRSFFWP